MPTKKEAARLTAQENTLCALGFTPDEAERLRRISLTLRRWHELECGIDGGCIERDDATGRPYWRADSGRRWPVADRETGALRRLGRIMADHASLSAYIQPDPRGAALYILRPGDVPAGASADSYYTRGLCVY
jgi:hypothetical protein